MKLILSGQHFSKSMGPSSAGNSHGNSRNWAKVKLVQDFTSILVIYTLSWRHHFPIKMKSLSSAQHFPRLWDTKGQVTIRPTVQTALKSNLSKILCLSPLSADEDPIKNEVAIIQTTFSTSETIGQVTLM